MCYNAPGPRCAGHTRTLFRETKAALIEANENYEKAKSNLSEAKNAQAEAEMIRSEALLKLARANHDKASKNYEASKAVRAEKMEAYRAAKGAYFESAEGIQALRDAGKHDEAEKYATIREMKLEELKRVEAAKADVANGAIRAVIEKPVATEPSEPSMDKLSVWERQDIVLNSKIDSATLHKFVKDDNEIIRKSIAMNWNASEATLLELADDETTVVASVATNRYATFPVLNRTVRNASRQIRLDSVNHEAWCGQTKLLDEHESVKGMGAHEIDLEVWDATPERLDQLATSSVPGIAYRVAEHRNVLPSTLEKLAFHPSAMVRQAAVENSNWSVN